MDYFHDLTARLFGSSWVDLHARDAFKAPDLKVPGVYIIAFDAKPLDKQPIDVSDVAYVGVTVSDGGLFERVRRFRQGLRLGYGHSAANRIFAERCGRRPFLECGFKERFFFASVSIPCNSMKHLSSPEDFRLMGHALCLENYALAHVLEKTGRLPAFNSIGPKREAKRKIETAI